MPEDALRQMAGIAKLMRYPANTLLCREGAHEEVFYIIGEGQVIISQQLGSSERFLRYADPGQYFGEMALIANSPRNANVRTTVDSAFLEVDKAAFIEILRQNPVIALTMFQNTVGWLRANDRASLDDLHRQNQALEEAYEALQIQEKRRSEFLTTLAHELRTPLTSSNGFMKLIKGGTMTGPALQMGLDKVANGLERVVSLVNDLLFVQEMDLIEPTLRLVDLLEILNALVDESASAASQNGLNIIINVPQTLPTIEADPDGLLRALRAILDNAIKFSPNGGEVRIDVVASDDYLDIAVKDPGIGIEPEFLPKIFERFEHQEKRGDHLFGGIGLGLAIARHVIESFGGHILVESKVDEGSTFKIRLPVLVQSEAARAGKNDSETR
jgi:signal transduction histidine kinase